MSQVFDRQPDIRLGHAIAAVTRLCGMRRLSGLLDYSEIALTALRAWFDTRGMRSEFNAAASMYLDEHELAALHAELDRWTLPTRKQQL